MMTASSGLAVKRGAVWREITCAKTGQRFKAKITGRLSLKRKSHLGKGPEARLLTICLLLVKRLVLTKKGIVFVITGANHGTPAFFYEYLSGKLSALRLFHSMENSEPNFSCPPTLP